MKTNDIDSVRLRVALRLAWERRIKGLVKQRTVDALMRYAQDEMILERDEVIDVIASITSNPKREIRAFVEDNYAFDS